MKFCLDINECLRNPCDVNAVCDNTDGSYSCTCKTGYSGDGVFCAGKPFLTCLNWYVIKYLKNAIMN